MQRADPAGGDPSIAGAHSAIHGYDVPRPANANEQIAALTEEPRRSCLTLSEGLQGQREAQEWGAELVANQTVALASIEENKLREIRRIGHALCTY